MKTRNLFNLIETKEFQDLINNYSVLVSNKDGNLLLKNNNIYIYIYCYMIDGYANFLLFDINNQTFCPDIRYLISDIINDSIRQIYKFYDETHLESVINEGIPGEVKMESSILARIEIMKTFFLDLLEGRLEKYEKYFEPMSKGYEEIFDELKRFTSRSI